MPSLQDLLQIYPVAESIASALPLGALLNLAKTNHAYRDILHGFPVSDSSSPCQESQHDLNPQHVGNTFPSPESRELYYPYGKRPHLHLGHHQTRQWINYKSKTQLLCSEPQHVKGPNVRGCVMCSMPVCEGCIVRASFGKNENTFSNRKRYLCQACWAAGVPHKECRYVSPCPSSPSVAARNRSTFKNRSRENLHTSSLTAEMDPTNPVNPTHPSSVSAAFDYSEDICTCSAKDGWLCLACKITQRTNLDVKLNTCCGVGCYSSPGPGRERRRVCLWCDLALPPKATLVEFRSEYDARHVFGHPMKYQFMLPLDSVNQVQEPELGSVPGANVDGAGGAGGGGAGDDDGDGNGDADADAERERERSPPPPPFSSLPDEDNVMGDGLGPPPDAWPD